MNIVIFRSCEKQEIIDVKELLIQNNIIISSINLHIKIEWRQTIGRGGSHIIKTEEKSDELNIPIEAFDDKLNNAQTFEIYVNEKDEKLALSLIEDYNGNILLNNYVFKTKIYDNAYKIFNMLNTYNIPCYDIIKTYSGNSDEEYLVTVDVEYKEMALKLIEEGLKKNIH